MISFIYPLERSDDLHVDQDSLSNTKKLMAEKWDYDKPIINASFHKNDLIYPLERSDDLHVDNDDISNTKKLKGEKWN